MNKTLKLIIKILLTVLVWIIGIYTLNKYDYISRFNIVDNVIGMLPIILVLVIVLGISSIIWISKLKNNKLLFTTIILLVLGSIFLFPKALIGDIWIGTVTIKEAEAKPDMSLYVPFSENSLLVKLDEEPSLFLKSDLPKLDGATALYPVYSAFAEAVYNKEVYQDDTVVCSNTKFAYEAIRTGEADVIFVAGASKQQIATAKEDGVDLVFTPIGIEAFVFIVGKDNPIDNITYDQIKNIYSGKTAYWATLGWNEGGRIIAFQRPEGSGSQTGLQNIMKDTPIQVPQPLPDNSLIGTNSLMKQVSVVYNGVQPALGYSYRYYATVMYANEDTKLLSVNGIYPSTDNIQNGSYPFTANFYAVTSGEPTGNTKELIDWILSDQGQKIIVDTGYSPISK